MKRALVALLVMLAMQLCAGLTHAAGPPLRLAHTLTGYQKEDAVLTLEYSLHLVNQGDAALTELNLTLVPLPPLVGSRPTVSVGYIGPREETDVKVQIQTRSPLDERIAAAARLFWAVRYVNADGKTVEIPLQSRAGGAK